MTRKLIVLVVVASFVLGYVIYPLLPQLMASHWNMQGQIDGYMPRFWGVFLMPLISLAMLGLFYFLPKIDPLKKNVAGFRTYFDSFILVIILFLFYIYFLTLEWNLGNRFNLIKLMAPAMAVLFYYAGVLIAHAKRNWFIGIRTPWTLSSDKVWDRTHFVGGKLFKICAVFCALGFFIPKIAIWLILVPVLLSTVYLFLYSYQEFKKE